MMHLKPTHAHAKGELRSVQRGLRPLGKTLAYATGVWLLESALPAGAPLDDHLRWLLDRLEPRKRTVFRMVREGLRADFIIGYFSESGQGGPSLSADTLRRLGRFGCDLGFNLYPAAEARPTRRPTK